jgi:hypothetical protein
MIKVLIEDCGVKLPAEMSIEGDALLITPNEPLHKDEAGECEYIVSGWQDGEQRCIWVAIVKGNIAIKHGQMYYDTIAGVFIDSSFSAAESFWVDKHMGSAEFMRIADDEERKKLDDALAAHGLEFDKAKGELVMKDEEWYCPAWDDNKCRFYPAVCKKEDELWYHKRGWLFAMRTGAQALCDRLNERISKE